MVNCGLLRRLALTLCWLNTTRRPGSRKCNIEEAKGDSANSATLWLRGCLWCGSGMVIGPHRERDSPEARERPCGWRESGMATVLNRLDESEKFQPPVGGTGDGYRPSAEEPFMNPR